VVVALNPSAGQGQRPTVTPRQGASYEVFLAEAAASKLRAEALAEFLADWQAEHGALTAEEIGRAEQELGLATGGTAA
jgi:hypothetical protein